MSKKLEKENISILLRLRTIYYRASIYDSFVVVHSYYCESIYPFQNSLASRYIVVDIC